MRKKEQNVSKEKERVEAVLSLLRKQEPLTVKQEKLCNNACIERFLKAKGDNVKKAAKQLRNCLSWRHSLAIDHLIADEFSAELAEGAAYVSGHDDESRPVLIFRIKQDCHKFHSQKLFTRLLVFTLEVAIQTMIKGVEQFVILFDASFFRSASAFMNILLPTLKIITDYYPGRLHKAFVIDPPSLFSYLWKGVKAFVELAPLTMVVSSLDFEESLDFNNFTSYDPKSTFHRFNSPSISTTAKIGSCSSSRFALTVSNSFDSLKPWSLTLTDTSSSKLGPTISPLNARSYSFALPVARTPRGNIGAGKKGFFPSTPLPQKTQDLLDPSCINHPRAMRSSFFQSPAMFFKKEGHVSKTEKSRESFVPFLKFYRRPYDEMTYRSKMRPPLGGLISIVSPHIQRHHISVSQRF
ncbi:PREDICTED: SEC14 cytosolic factor-like [Nicotiana attenuata]|uniref:CRAL-TRIO domain-containing protein n=1 Tax=Nicotiana attenuata TaxID=49451 RepID=A0A1J6IXV2_NICAT|nr:PREDICTED: SEC14 cytosolic factor-like [Nicotiana attenuata]OIT03603.1 hypothetical protein A4A49_38651 [Nicotiana attenuata]